MKPIHSDQIIGRLQSRITDGLRCTKTDAPGHATFVRLSVLLDELTIALERERLESQLEASIAQRQCEAVGQS